MRDLKPFAGKLVIDASQGLAGPYAGAMAARFGAEVIKVEPPAGDWARKLGMSIGGQTALTTYYNNGKKGICLDLKKEEDKQTFLKLIERADAVIESGKVGVADRLGVGYDALSSINPKIIYISISGFGVEGPYAKRPCTDTVAQAFSGFMTNNQGMDGNGHRLDIPVIDICCGLYAYQALSMALVDVQAGGSGGFFDVSLMATAAEMQAGKLIEAAILGEQPKILTSPAGTYNANDADFALTVVGQEQYENVCRAIGADHLITDPRFATPELRVDNKPALDAAMNDVFAAHGVDHWLQVLGDAGVLANRVNNLIDWMNDPHVQLSEPAMAFEQPGMGNVFFVKAAATGALPGTPAPGIDEHRPYVLDLLKAPKNGKGA